MNILAIVTITTYLIGYYFLIHSQLILTDPMQHMNLAAAPLLEDLVQTKYFRIIRLNINQQCPLGILNKICKSNSCSVCRCD